MEVREDETGRRRNRQRNGESDGKCFQCGVYVQRDGVTWQQMGVNVCIGVEWGEVMLSERQKRKAACVWRDLRVGGVLVWAGGVVRWGQYCLRRAE